MQSRLADLSRPRGSDQDAAAQTVEVAVRRARKPRSRSEVRFADVSVVRRACSIMTAPARIFDAPKEFITDPGHA
jgi:hypothetical protein